MLKEEKMKVSAIKEFTVGDFWEAIFCSEGAGSVDWSSKVRQADGKDLDIWIDEDSKPNPQDIKIYEDEEKKWHTVTLEGLRIGYERALTEGQTHCGTYPLDIKDNDACFGDIVIQYAIFNEIKYG
jgi:hypothetical protein